VADSNPYGLIYAFNFSRAYNTSQNFSDALSTVFSSNVITPQYLSGAMLANDDEFFLYGGVLDATNGALTPPANSVDAYNLYAASQGGQFHLGILETALPDAITRYITYGASVSAPSENLGFYFAGLRTADFGEMYYLSGNESLNPDVESATLIQLNMTQQGNPVWSNNSLPPAVLPRAGAEIVWLPFSEHGILVAIGGVVDPAFATINQTLNAASTAESVCLSYQTFFIATNSLQEIISPTFMSTVSIYDIATQQWYEQNTTGAPGQLTQGCSVVASAQDGSSHNIYWYGGFDGIDIAGELNDDVWILSIPSFTWFKVVSGEASHARAGHVCAKPYPDQMIVVGGYTSLAGDNIDCLRPGFVQVFNLSNLTWISGYDPTIWSNYSVPEIIFNMIGGDATGGATQTEPTPSGFANDKLSSLFNEAYATSKITTYYPYPLADSTTTLTPSPTPTPAPTQATRSSRTQKYLGPVLGTVLGLVVVVATLVVIWLWRRRLSHTREEPYTYSENDKEVDPFGGTRGKSTLEIDGNELHEAGGRTFYEMTSMLITNFSLPFSLQFPGIWNLTRNRCCEPCGDGCQPCWLCFAFGCFGNY
jgi:hypothetical protein